MERKERRRTENIRKRGSLLLEIQCNFIKKSWRKNSEQGVNRFIVITKQGGTL